MVIKHLVMDRFVRAMQEKLSESKKDEPDRTIEDITKEILSSTDLI